MKTLITCGWLVTVDPELGEIRNGEILIEDDRIVAVGRSLDAQADRVIDCSTMIVMPGLIDSHVHLWQSSVRGLAAGWLGPEYFEGIHLRVARQCNPHDNYLGNLLGALSYIDNGVTTILDYCHNLDSRDKADASIDGLEESGIRAQFAYSPAKGLEDRPYEHVATLREERLFDDDARVTMSLGLLGPVWAPRDDVEAGIALARGLGIPMSSHATFHDSMSVWPGGYRELARAGLLGPDHNLVHGNFIGDEELKEILDTGAAVISTSVLELQVGFPRPVIDRVLAFGGTPALGTDVPVSVAGDMFREMQASLQSVRTAAFDAAAAAGAPPPQKTPAIDRDALEWATVGSAKAMALDTKIGRIAPGMKADLVGLRTTDLNVFPVFDPIATIVSHAGTKNVDTVIIDGVVRKQGGELLYDQRTLETRKDELLEAATRIVADSGVKADA